jgi:hypothetical protein
METGLQGLPRRRAPDDSAGLRALRIEPEITAKIARRGLRIFEVPTHHGREVWEGKKIGPRDALGRRRHPKYALVDDPEGADKGY